MRQTIVLALALTCVACRSGEGGGDAGRDAATLPGTVTLPRVATGIALPGYLDDAELRADVTLGGLADGHLGGSTPLSWLVAESERLNPGIGPPVQTILETYADIAPTTIDPLTCGDLSSAITISAVPAVRTL